MNEFDKRIKKKIAGLAYDPPEVHGWKTELIVKELCVEYAKLVVDALAPHIRSGRFWEVVNSEALKFTSPLPEDQDDE